MKYFPVLIHLVRKLFYAWRNNRTANFIDHYYGLRILLIMMLQLILMDSVLANLSLKRRSSMEIFTIIVSIVNIIISIILSYNAYSSILVIGLPNIMVFLFPMLCVELCVLNLALLYYIYIGKNCQILLCLEFFIVLFILNFGVMTSEEPVQLCINNSISYSHLYDDKKYIYDIFMALSKIFYVIIVVEIYLVYRYYNYELKVLEQNISPTSTVRENPSAPAEQCQMVPSNNNPQHPGQNIIHYAGPNNQYIQEPRQFVIQPPGTSAFNPHFMQSSFPPEIPTVQH